jgi:hypothetical protein
MNKAQAYGFVLVNVAAQLLAAAAQVALLPPAWVVYGLGLIYHENLAFIFPLLLLALLLVYAPRTMVALTQAWLVALFALTAPVVVPFITITGPSLTSVRWRVYNTLDDLAPDQGTVVGSTFEPQVVAVLNALGYRWKTWYWLAGRNVAYGFAHLFIPRYDFATARLALVGNAIVMTWGADGRAEEVYWPRLTGPRVMFGYKLHSFFDITKSPPVSTLGAPGPNDVGGVPFVTVRLK